MRVSVSDQILLPIVTLVGCSMALLVGLAWFSAIQQDKIAAEQSVTGVASTIEDKLRQIGAVAKDFSWWNDAVRHLDLSLDKKWADVNVGYYVYEQYGYETSIVVGRDGRVIYSQTQGKQEKIDIKKTFSGGLNLLIEEAQNSPWREPEPATGLLALENGLALVGVSAVSLEEEADIDLPLGRRLVLVLVKHLNKDLLLPIGDMLQLNALKVVDVLDPQAEAMLSLVAPNSTRLGFLVWQPQQPGHGFLISVAPALTIAILIVAVFAVVVVRRIRESTRALEASESRFRDVADASSDWIWETDAELRLRYLSDRFSQSTGRSLRSVVGRPIEEFLRPVASQEKTERFRNDLKERRHFRDLLYICEDSNAREMTLRVAGKPIVDDRGVCQGFRGTATDISAEIEAQGRIRHLALHDPLTGLPNRTLLCDRIETAIASAIRHREKMAVLVLDLDRFKGINDTLGHTAGDLLLRICAQRLQRCIREIDTVARIGGDEFAIVQNGSNQPSGAEHLCQRLLNAMAEPFNLSGHEVLVTPSIGISIVPADGSDSEQLLPKADIALYQAKKAGGATFVFYEQNMGVELRKRKVLENDLRLALQNDQLELFYQPKVDLRSLRLSGVEALVRWRHPKRGLLAPSEFIGLAEETGSILMLGEQVIRMACAQAAAWPQLDMSINISPIQFTHRDLVGIVRHNLDEFGIEPQRLELEITEGVLLENTERAVLILQELKNLGIRLVMDDFGMQYSGLSYLELFPFDKIKIDRSFVGGIALRPHAEAIIRAVVGLGHSLGMSICAEGVEIFEQLRFLEGEECDEIQGHYIGKPMSAKEFERHFINDEGHFVLAKNQLFVATKPKMRASRPINFRAHPTRS